MKFLRDLLLMIGITSSGLAACNYTDGECYPRGEGYGSEGVGGTTTVSGGVGGFGDVPLRPQDAPDPQDFPDSPDCNAAPEHACTVPGSVACVEQCNAIGAYCAHKKMHPYSPSSGAGDLYWCKGGSPTYTCSFQYANGDNCTVIYPMGTAFCRYIGGKKEP